MPEPDPVRIDAALAAVLPPQTLYAVGGRVRDEVRSAFDGIERPAKDLDYVVAGLELADLLERMRRLGTADVAGAAFSVVKVTIGGVTVDVALPRRERSTGLGHRDFTVEAGPDVPLEDDLARRDFRMNMLARALPDGALVDPYGGADDIRDRRIDLLRPEALEEDPLRMLRACQFAARFAFRVTEATMAAMRSAAPLVTTVSPERVRDELVKLLGAAVPSAGFELMREGDVLGYVLPEVAEGFGVGQNAYHAYDVYRHGLATLDAVPAGDTVLRLAALFHDVAKPRTKSRDTSGTHFYRHEVVGETLARLALERLRFPNDTSETVGRLVRNHMYGADPELEAKTIRRFIKRIGPELLERQFALRAADIVGSGLPKRGDENERFEACVKAVAGQAPPLSVGDLAVDGDDVIKVLVEAGRLPQGSRGDAQVGTVLRYLLERVMDDPAANTAGTLLALLAPRGGAAPHGAFHVEPELDPFHGERCGEQEW